MTTAQPSTGPSAPVKSVWKKVTETKDLNPPSALHTLVNGSSVDESHDRESISSKDIAHGEGSSQGHSTPASSMAGESTQIGSPEEATTPTPIFRPAPLPAVNPWKARQEEAERKRWKDSQDAPIAPIPLDRAVPKQAPQPLQPKSTNKPNGVGKQEGANYIPASSADMCLGKSSRQKAKAPIVPPALEDPEAWPSPDVAATVEKEDRNKPILSISVPKETKTSPTIRDSKDVELKEPRDGKKKKWEKIEVNFQYDPPQSRRGRGGKFNNRNARGGAREAVSRTKDGEKEESRPRHPQRSDGEEPNATNAREAVHPERRAQSLSFDPGHPHSGEVPAQDWQPPAYRNDSLPAPPSITHEPVPVTPQSAQKGSSPSLTPHHEQQKDRSRSRSGQRSRSPKSPLNAASPNGMRPDPSEQPQSPVASPTNPPFRDESHWEDNQNYDPNNSQANPQGTQPRRGNGRRYGPRNSYSPNAFPGGNMAPPQTQVPFPGPFYQMYPSVQPQFGPPGRSHSVPYFTSPANSSLPRYPANPYPQFMPDYSRLGVQPAAVTVDEDTKSKIIRQVYVPQSPLLPQNSANGCREYWFSEENLYKDTFLRKKMDGQGYVPISELLGFTRLQSITKDLPIVLAALISSLELEILPQSERGPLVRTRHDWAKWVFPENEREEAAQHPGPADIWYSAPFNWYRAQHEAFQQQQPPYPPPQPYFDQQYTFPPAQFRVPSENELSPPILNEEPQLPPQSLHFDPQNRKLSGDANPFVPNGVPYQQPMVNGHDVGAFDMHAVQASMPPVSEEEEVDVLDDDSLGGLVVTITEPKDRPIIPALPMNGVNPRSERDLDIPRSPTAPVTWRFSDVTAATQASTPSVKSGLSSLTLPQDDAQTSKSRSTDSALTEKNLKKQAVQSGVSELAYQDFETKALESRKKSSRESVSMIRLYQFWSDFLCDYWVPAMYTSFVKYAVEDANNMRRTGLLKLFSFYERVLTRKFRMLLWNDFIRLAGEDYRNGHLAGIESVWRIRRETRDRNVGIQDGDVSRLVDGEIRESSDFEQLRKEVKPAEIVLVPYTIVPHSLALKASNRRIQSDIA
jgi:La domain